MVEPAESATGTHIEHFPYQQGENLIHESGSYINTTRVTKDQSYLYMWKRSCTFSKWTPTNQFLHKNQGRQSAINWKELDLSRFGFIGSDKQCFWGLISVHWHKPLPVA
jgi:acetylglutamate synthase